MEFNNVRKMASPKQMVMKVLFIAIAIYVVTSQDIFGNPGFSRACYGTSGKHCQNTKLSCGNDENVLISETVYKGKQSACSGECKKEACCDGEQNISEEKILNLNKMEINEACSGKQSCTLLSPNYALTNSSGRVTSTEVKYYCIEKRKIINYCETIKQSNTTVHIMYNGETDHYEHRDCYCSIQADHDIDLYSVDIRLQNQDSTSPKCTNTTLKWGYNQIEYVEQCKRFDDHSRLRKLNVTKTKDMWVRLSIQHENPTMVWIAAKATSGTVNVTCGQQNENTEGTTTTLSTTSHTTTINTKAQNKYSAITSDSGSTTVPGSVMPPTESSTSTSVVYTGPHSRNTVSDDDTDIGTIVGPVIAIVLIAVLVVIGIIFLKKRRAKQQSSQSTTSRAYEGLTGSSKSGSDNKAYDIISDYDISNPTVLPTGSKATNGEPIDLSSSFGDSHKQGDENAISDVGDDIYSDINPKDMASDDPSRNDNSESDYNHLHGLKACETDAQSGNVYSHLKNSLRNTSPCNDEYDHFGCNKPNSLKENNVSSLSANEYDHLSSAKINNATDCNQPITTHIQQATTKDATDKTSDNSNTPEGFYAATTSQQIEPSCEYAQVKRGKPVAASDDEMAGILNDVEV